MNSLEGTYIILAIGLLAIAILAGPSVWKRSGKGGKKRKK